MSENYQITIDDLVEGSTLSHLYVQNRNIEKLKILSLEFLLSQDNDGETALHYAATNDDIEICKLLIQKCPQLVNIKDVDSKTAYDWAKSYNEEYNSHIDVCDYFKNINTKSY
jgi:ankyrin repeat protein